MKKKSLTVLVVTALASSMLFSSCIGSFGLFNRLLDWNKNIDNKFVNELVFVVFLPVYSVAMLADGLVLNSIEFWSGTNPVADAGTVKKIETKDGTYAIETKQDGYHIQKEGEKDALDLASRKRFVFAGLAKWGSSLFERGEQRTSGEFS